MKGIINLCDTCKFVIPECGMDIVKFACDIYPLNELEEKQYDAIIECNTYQKDL
jgi:hypothetical protein